jgi:predicted dehydrogenase
MITLAGLVGPTLVPSGVLAAPGRPGANDRVLVGFIGIGRQASDLLKILVGQKDARFIAVADVNLKRAQEAAAKHDATPYQNYRRLLENKDVDAVVTATPDHWRGPIVLESCQAGKDLYVEKPMTYTHFAPLF